jgi:hypothetical protein
MPRAKEHLADPTELAAFAQGAASLYKSGIRNDNSGWWAIVWQFVGAGQPAREVVRSGPFATEAQAAAHVDDWGARKEKLFNTFK